MDEYQRDLQREEEREIEYKQQIYYRRSIKKNMRRYLITFRDMSRPFLTDYFNPENFEKGMTVYDLVKNKYTINGKDWRDLIFEEL